MKHIVEQHLVQLGMKIYYVHPTTARMAYIHQDDDVEHNLHIPLYVSFRWDTTRQLTEAFLRLGGMLSTRTGEPVFMLDVAVKPDRLLELTQIDMNALRHWGEQMRDSRMSIFGKVASIIENGVV